MITISAKAVTLASVVCQERRTEVGWCIVARSWRLLTAALQVAVLTQTGCSDFSEAVCESGLPAHPCLQYVGSVLRSVLAVIAVC